MSKFIEHVSKDEIINLDHVKFVEGRYLNNKATQYKVVFTFLDNTTKTWIATEEDEFYFGDDCRDTRALWDKITNAFYKSESKKTE